MASWMSGRGCIRSTIPVDPLRFGRVAGSICEDNSSSLALDRLHRLCPKFRDRACWHDVLIGISQTAQEPPCRSLLNAVRSGA